MGRPWTKDVGGSAEQLTFSELLWVRPGTICMYRGSISISVLGSGNRQVREIFGLIENKNGFSDFFARAEQKPKNHIVKIVVAHFFL